MGKHLVWLFLGMVVACDKSDDGGSGRVEAVPPEGAPTTVPTPSSTITLDPESSAPQELEDSPPVVSAEAPSASAAASAAPAESLLGSLRSAHEVKVTRLHQGDATLEGPERVEPILAAIGLAQTTKDECPRGQTSVTLVFKDRFGTRLGSLSLFEGKSGFREEAALRDPLGSRCEQVKLAKPGELAGLLGGSKPAASAAP